jgi:hypothetical protein
MGEEVIIFEAAAKSKVKLGTKTLSITSRCMKSLTGAILAIS